MFTNFFNNNKGKLFGSLAGPAGIIGGTAYDYLNKRRNRTPSNKAIDEYRDESGKVVRNYRPKANEYDFGMSYADGYGPGVNKAPAVYTGQQARNVVNKGIDAYNRIKDNQANLNIGNYDPLANAGQLSNKRTKDEDGEEGPSLLDQYLSEIQAIQAGKFKYSAVEKQNIENLKSTGRQAELRQSRVNDNYQGGTLQGELRSGRSRYAQEIADDALINAMQTGVDAINRVDLETQKAVTDLEVAIKEERMRQIAEKYGLLQEQEKQKNDVALSLQQQILDAQEYQASLLTTDAKNFQFAQNNPGFRQYQSDLEAFKKRGKFAPRASTNSSSSSTASRNPFAI